MNIILAVWKLLDSNLCLGEVVLKYSNFEFECGLNAERLNFRNRTYLFLAAPRYPSVREARKNFV